MTDGTRMAEAFDEHLDLADIYAAALFALASEAGLVETVRGELEELVRLETLEPGFAEFLRSGAVDDDHRAASLERMFRGKLSDIVLNTLQVMNARGRAALLKPLLRAFVLREQQAANQVEVTVRSAVELDADTRERLERVTEMLSGKRPLMQYEVDAALLGGLVLQIGDYRYDNSIRRHLLQAHARLLGRGARGLKAGVVET
jgi:F-type H+-transporting ATPase subunit delta